MRKRILRVITLTLLLLVGTVAWRDTMTVALTSAEVPVSGLRRPVTILHASDLHGASFGEGQHRIAAVLEGAHYDAAVINGDHIPTHDADPTPVLELLSLLREHADIVFVTRGNHDTSAVMDTLVAHGAIAIEPGNDEIPFAADAGTLVAVPAFAHGSAPADATLVLALGHYPLTEETIAAQMHGTDAKALYLFGHNHNGQVRLPFVGAVWTHGEKSADLRASRKSSGQNFFPELRGRMIAGLRGDDSVSTHISNGLGTQGIRLRLLAPAEMTAITLTPAP